MATTELQPGQEIKRFLKEDSEEAELTQFLRDCPPADSPRKVEPPESRREAGHSPSGMGRVPSEESADERDARIFSRARPSDFQQHIAAPPPPSPNRPRSPWGQLDPYDSSEDDKEYVGFATLPNQVHRKSVKKGFDFTLMVAGESGLGKSTLVNSLFLTDMYRDRKLLNAEERITQTVEITKHVVDIEEKGVKLRLTIVDTPGFGDAVNNTEWWAEVVAAVDVNTLANEVYKHNFPGTPLWAKTIEGITLQEFDRLSFDMVLMSPPCQPFTRTGLQGDVSDPRTKSFLYMLHVLPRLQKLPTYLLLENVKGFESSSARKELLQTLETCEFEYQEFLLSPTCLGIPNSRLRYFLLARRHQDPFPFWAPGQILTRFPDQDLEDFLKHEAASKEGEVSSSLSPEEKSLSSNTGPDGNSKSSLVKGPFLFKLETAEEMERKQSQDTDPSIQMLEDFLEEEDEEQSHYFLPPKSLLRYASVMDIVKPSCRRSTCFTKGYGHYVEGTGSVLQTAVDVQLESVFKHIEELPEEEKLMKLSTLKLRYFTPREIANLHGFPLEFGFPEQVTVKQRYRLLGNSLNVLLVARLISILLG